MPEIYNLLYHLKQCPEEFLQPDYPGTVREHHSEVLVKDIFRKIYGNFNVPDSSLPSLTHISHLNENERMSVHVGCWFFSYDYFSGKNALLPKIYLFLFQDLPEVCQFVKYREWVEEEDRAEEFIRLALKRLHILPQSETAEQAAEKLDALDTLKRQEVLKESNESLERIREIRRKMAEQKAREAANVYGRE